MSTEILSDLHQRLTLLAEEDRPAGLLKALEADLQAERSSFPACIVAIDATSTACLQALLPEANALRPYSDVSEWTAEEREALERAGVMVVMANVRQLLPRILSEALEHAVGRRTPVAVLISGLGRMQSPASAADGAARALSAVLGRTSFRYAFLGEPRFEGPALEKAMEEVLSPLRAPGERGLTLSRSRQAEACEWIAQRIKVSRKHAQDVSSDLSLVCDSARAMERLAQANGAAWQWALTVMRDAVGRVDLESVLTKARPAQDLQKALDQLASGLRETVAAALKAARKEASAQLTQELDQFARRQDQDIERLESALRERHPVIGRTAEGSRAKFQSHLRSVDARLAGLEKDCLDAVVLPEFVTRLATLLARPEREDKPHKPKKSTFPSTESKPNTLTRALERLRALSEQAFRNHLRTACEDILAEAQSRLGLRGHSAAAAWGDELARDVAEAYAPLRQQLEALNAQAQARLTRLLEAYEYLR